MFKKIPAVLLLAAIAILIIPLVAAAQDFGFEYADSLDLGTTDVRSTAIQVINVALGFLGIVCLVLIIYGGFLWFTAGGDEEKITKAKKTLTSAIIGLVIILASYGIVRFVLGEVSSSLGGRQDSSETSTSSPTCEDADGDGYGVEFCGTDCDDTNPAINPGVLEVCSDGIDNNCNGDIDGDDSDCTSSSGPPVESVVVEPQSEPAGGDPFTITVTVGESQARIKDFLAKLFKPAQAQEVTVTALVNCGFADVSVPLDPVGGNTYSGEWQTAEGENYCPGNECACQVRAQVCEAGECGPEQTSNNFEVADQEGPTLPEVGYVPIEVPLGQPIEMTFEIIDVSGVDSVIAYIPGEEEEGIALEQVEEGSNYWSGEWTPPSDITEEAFYSLELEATDNLEFNTPKELIIGVTLIVNPSLIVEDCELEEDIDTDGDGYARPGCGGTDCDDGDSGEKPGVVWYLDVDGDGYREEHTNPSFCQKGEAGEETDWTSIEPLGKDCDDTDLSINPGAKEGPMSDLTCSDGIDNDCDDSVDEAEPECCPRTWGEGICYTVNPYIMKGCHPDWWSPAVASEAYPEGMLAFDKKNPEFFFDVCTVDPTSSTPDADATCLTPGFTVPEGGEWEKRFGERHYGGPTWHPDGDYMVISMSKSWDEIAEDHGGVYDFELSEDCRENPQDPDCPDEWASVLPGKDWDWIWSDFRYRTNPGQGLFNTLNYLSADGTEFERILWCPGETKETQLGAGPGESSTNYPGVIHSHFDEEDGRLFWSERIVHTSDMCRPVFERACRDLTDDEWEAIEWGQWQMMVGSVNTETYTYPCLENVEAHGPGQQPYFYETHGFSPVEGSDELLFSANLEPLQGAFYIDIYSYDPDHDLSWDGLTRLTETTDQWDEHAHWSPSGDWIAWMSSSGVDYSLSSDIYSHIGTQFMWAGVLQTELWIMRANGSGKKRLTFFNDSEHPHYEFFGADQVIVSDMSWSPDGRKLAVSLGAGGWQYYKRIVIIEFNEPM